MSCVLTSFATRTILHIQTLNISCTWVYLSIMEYFGLHWVKVGVSIYTHELLDLHKHYIVFLFWRASFDPRILFTESMCERSWFCCLFIDFDTRTVLPLFYRGLELIYTFTHLGCVTEFKFNFFFLLKIIFCDLDNCNQHWVHQFWQH